MQAFDREEFVLRIPGRHRQAFDMATPPTDAFDAKLGDPARHAAQIVE